ncbi:unnamed protein product [Paramecium primaurelia]|uniref:Major facilitator superfamily (MFS) profile domain-containing protein n=1 Tax=Paramecium primaurelia TaxID=5886 RepID=A0A8S1QAE7_PARPR|nr:unnamed protein product [Paramecium primaurelia]
MQHQLPFSTNELEHFEIEHTHGSLSKAKPPVYKQKDQLIVNKIHTVQLDHEIDEDVNSKFHFTVIMVGILSGNFGLGYSLPYLSMSFSTVFSQIELKGSETSEQGFFSAILSIGCLIGAIFTKFLLKYTTRNQSLMIADFCGFLSIFAVIPNREVILTFRFFYGVCIGIQTIIMPIYLKELCPQKYYDKFSVMSGFFVGGGLLFANFMGLGYINNDLRGKDSHYWQIVFAIPAIVFLFRFTVLTIIYKMDSPISLIIKNKPTKAKEIISYIYQSVCVEQAFQKSQLRVQYDEEHKEGIMILFTRKHRRTLAIGCVLMFVYTWCGLFAIFSYSSQFFASMSNGDVTLNTFFTLILGIVQFTPAFISSIVYRRWGKRIILLTGLFLMIICQILIIGLSYTEALGAVIVKFIVICLFSFLYALTLGPITWSMTPEINSSEGTYFCFVTLYAWQLLVLYIFPFMLSSLEMSGSFVVFAILTISSILFFYCFVKETKGLNHTEIDKVYGKEDK